MTRVAAQVAALGQQVAHPVEDARDRVGPALDPAQQRLGLALQPAPAARPSGRGPPARRSRGTGARAAARRSRRSSSSSAARRPAGRGSCAPRSAPPAGRAFSALRRVAARSRRAAALRALKCFGTAIRVTRLRRAGTSTSDSRRTCRSAVSTVGRGPSAPPATPASITTACPARRPAAGTRMTSPRRSRSSEATASARRSRDAARDSSASRSPIRRRSAAYSVKSPRWQRHRLGVAGQRLLLPARLPGQADHRPVGLELRERRLQDLPGPRAADLADEVDRHVVRRPEAGAQRVGPGRGQPGHRLRVQARLPEHDGVPLDVDPAPAGAPGELRVLPRGDVGVGLAVELHQLLQHDAAGRHVDAQRQRLGGEHGLDQAAGEQLLDHLLERRQQPGVVRGDAALQRVGPLPVAEHGEVLVGDVGAPRVHDPADLARAPPASSAAAPRRRTAATAASQPARLKMNVIAGSRPAASRRRDDLGPARHAARRPRRRGWPGRGRARATVARTACGHPLAAAPALAGRAAATTRRG